MDIEFDCSYIEDWKETMNNDCENGEVGSNWPVLTAHWQTREALWQMCQELEITVFDGTAAHAGRIMDRYLSIQAKRYFRRNGQSDHNLRKKWQDYQEGMAEQMPLIMITCIRIAAKFLYRGLYTHHIGAAESAFFLRMRDLQYTDQYLNEFEAEVLMTIQFRIPLWSSLQLAKYVAHCVGYDVDLQLIMSFVELCRSRIEDRARQSGAFENHGCMYLRTLPMCAGAVSALARLVQDIDVQELNRDLATFTDLPEHYIKCISNSILIVFYEEVM